MVFLLYYFTFCRRCVCFFGVIRRYSLCLLFVVLFFFRWIVLSAAVVKHFTNVCRCSMHYTLYLMLKTVSTVAWPVNLF